MLKIWVTWSHSYLSCSPRYSGVHLCISSVFTDSHSVSTTRIQDCIYSSSVHALFAPGFTPQGYSLSGPNIYHKHTPNYISHLHPLHCLIKPSCISITAWSMYGMVNCSQRTGVSPLVLWTQFNIVRERFSSVKTGKKVKLFLLFFFSIFQCANSNWPSRNNNRNFSKLVPNAPSTNETLDFKRKPTLA